MKKSKPPEIQSVGLPPEKHADRVVAEIMRYIIAMRSRDWAEAKGILLDPDASDGNPRAQAKLLKKFRAAAGAFCLAADLVPGKRGRYSITAFTVGGWDPNRECTIEDEEAIPARPWITLNAFRLKGEGHGSFNYNEFPVLFFTHHALSRLAQRCGARTALEVYAAVAKIMVEFYLLLEQTTQGFSTITDNQRMRVKLPMGMGTAICVIRREGEKNQFTITTLWDEAENFLT
jgi:hypothetical protein